MTYLVDWEIKKFLGTRINPFKEENLNPQSLDVTLNEHGWGRTLAKYHACPHSHKDVDPLDKDSYLTQNFSCKKYRLKPREFILATINERLELPPDMVAEIVGKSSLARHGLLVHVSAGFGDGGWSGYFVLELVNLHHQNTLILTAGMNIAQIKFTRTLDPSEAYNEKPGSKYIDQKPGQGSLYYLNKETDNGSSKDNTETSPSP